ncbi:MAG: Gfo/Idh/MocA family protein [Reyranellaceae bacterium]
MTAGPILQIGYGAFGPTHARAWRAAGIEDLVVADPDPCARDRALSDDARLRVVEDYREALPACRAVDILTPTPTHCAIALEALRTGKPAFVEKPVVSTLVEAQILRRQALSAGLPLMAGYYFRYHPKCIELQWQIGTGALGELRLLTGKFAGYKRARIDSGVLHNDAVHFLDLFCWLVGRLPDRAFALARDHFGRGMDDTMLILLDWSGGPAAQIECGYVQPGRWPDTVVAGALTSKEIAVSGAKGAVEVDFAAETYVEHRVTHENRDGVWTPHFHAPAASRNVPPADAVAVLTAEFTEFLGRLDGAAPDTGFAADGLDGAWRMALLLEAIATSAASRQAITIREPTDDAS